MGRRHSQVGYSNRSYSTWYLFACGVCLTGRIFLIELMHLISLCDHSDILDWYGMSRKS